MMSVMWNGLSDTWKAAVVATIVLVLVFTPVGGVAVAILDAIARVLSGAGWDFA